jgi:phosphonate transport system substrate-binding protein
MNSGINSFLYTKTMKLGNCLSKASAASALALFATASCAFAQSSNASAGSPRPLRLALSAAFVSESGVGVYQKLADHLAVKMGIPCEFVSGLAYGTINDMLKTGAVDAAFVCGMPYVLERDKPDPSVVLVAAPVMKDARYGGKPQYFSDLIVKKDSPIRSFADLKGKVYVYNDKLSNSGYNMPRYKLVELGETKGYFGKVLRSGSHEESIRMVAQGEADASFVDSLVLDYDRAKGTGYAAAVRVIESRGPSSTCPVVASLKTPEDRRLKLQAALLGMDKDPAGRKILDEALVLRFDKVEDSMYNDIRGWMKAAAAAGYESIR